MKIVSFVDTLGFKQRVSSVSHEEAKNIIKSFNSEIYQLWQKLNYNTDSFIHGQTFSDSLIIYTDNDSLESLKKILIFLKEIYKISIIQCGLPLRGGISIGEFDKIPTHNFDNLHKELVIGTAFIDAYFLESTKNIKGSKLVFRTNINDIIDNNFKDCFHSKELIKLPDGEQLYELVWADIDFLTENHFEALNTFVNLARNSKWLDHYYHTLETFLTKENKRSKHKIFNKIIALLNNPTEQTTYYDVDLFIKNFLKTDGINHLQKAFLSYLREGIKTKQETIANKDLK